MGHDDYAEDYSEAFGPFLRADAEREMALLNKDRGA